MKERVFKAGDRITCIEKGHSAYLTVGKTYEVLDVNDFGDPKIVNDIKDDFQYSRKLFRHADESVLTPVTHTASGSAIPEEYREALGVELQLAKFTLADRIAKVVEDAIASMGFDEEDSCAIGLRTFKLMTEEQRSALYKREMEKLRRSETEPVSWVVGDLLAQSLSEEEVLASVESKILPF